MKTLWLSSLLVASACGVQGENHSEIASSDRAAAESIQQDSQKGKFVLRGDAAMQLFKQINKRNSRSVATVKNGRLSCQLNKVTFPRGAQGLFLPTARCTAYPNVEFPPGTMGRVASWFSLNGQNGYQLFQKMPVKATDNFKNLAIRSIRCDVRRGSKCVVKYTKIEVEQPKSFVVTGSVAKTIFDQIAQGRRAARFVVRDGSLNCNLVIPQIPPGAQGMFMATGSCSAYPHVTFPRGAQGLVAAWFQVNGILGADLYSSIPVKATDKNRKSVKVSKITCSVTNGAKCTFDLK